MPERRKSKRIDIDVQIMLNQLTSDDNQHQKTEGIKVDVVNLSKDGMAFLCEKELQINTFYDVNVVLWTKETFQTVIEIVRIEDNDNNKLYGCRFVGISASDQFKIEVYQIVSES